MKKLLLILIASLVFITPVRAGTPVNINSATQAQLESVKGIGPAKARAIIEYRSKMGPFRNVDDLKKVAGFGEKTVARIHSDLTVGGRPPAAKAETVKSR